MQQLEEQIDALSTELADKHQQQTTLGETLQEAETFLEENPLPSDRQPRLIQAKELLVELRSQRQQHTGKLDIQSEYILDIDRSKGELEKLSENRKKLLTEKENAEAALAKADTEFQAFQASGSLEDWRNRREQARQALSIAQSYEVSHDQLREMEHNETELQEHITTLDESLDDFKKKLEVQFHLCKRADAEVARLEAEKELALLANPINQLRRQLEPGQPCRVCGATEHPCADEVELESEAQLEIAQNALNAAETAAQKAQEQNSDLEQEQVRRQQNKTNIAAQIDACTVEIEKLKDKIESARTQWNALYETVDISPEWVQEKTDEANTAIDNLGNVRDAYNQASYKLKEVSEKLTTCERDIARENKLLDDNQQTLDAVTVEIKRLTTDIENSEARFRKLLPDTFHGIDLEDAVNQFDDKIETVAAYEQERDEKQNELAQCNIAIREKERSLETARDNHRELQSKIEDYRNVGNRFLDAARNKTDGLTTEEEIDTAIKDLDVATQAKADQCEAATQKLQESRNQRTEKQTNQRICQERRSGCNTHLATVQAAYFEKLSGAEFDSPEAHDSAFLADSEIRRIEKEIADFIQEKRSLDESIAILRAQFDKTPFDPQLLGRIAAQAKDIDSQIHKGQRDIWTQEKRIADLTDALSKREVLDDKIQEAAKELNRWAHLKSTIGENKLFNFASHIILGQVNRLANEQLDFLSSGRYQLKAEDIDERLKLTIIDRWNANDERPVETLSGGESFLTSLALALALSELSRGRSQIHSLFLDEGFGTLDSETLDVAIAALEGLQMQGRSIFLISHIGELTRRIPVRIAVEKMGNGSSRVQVRG